MCIDAMNVCRLTKTYTKFVIKSKREINLPSIFSLPTKLRNNTKQILKIQSCSNLSLIFFNQLKIMYFFF